ncbi:MAG: hypothetical protein HC799_17465 [Limnothrix sp. RL_2_0]|nr:hypothetical protein [Limnothrix sp. RL_2_0]
MNYFYFVGGCLVAIAFSNFLKLSARMFPSLTHPTVIILGVVVLIGLAVALLWEDTEQGLTAWFIGVCSLGLGVMLGVI